MKKLLSVLFVIVFAISLSTVAFAKKSYTEWTISNDGNSIMVDNSSYELYNGVLCPNDLFLPKSTFYYENEVDYFYCLKKNKDSNHIFSVSMSYDEELGDVYVDSEGKESLDSFLNGEYSSHIIADYSLSFYLSVESTWLDCLDGGSVKAINVKDLASLKRYYVLGYDQTGTIAHYNGAIYLYEGSYVFVNYDKLPNNYFDANGNFSYRSGTVGAYVLSVEQLGAIAELESGSNYFRIEYESAKNVKEDKGYGKGYHITVFVLITLIFGFALPIVPSVIGIIRIAKHKARNPKRWYLFFACCGLWVIFAILTMLFIIL